MRLPTVVSIVSFLLLAVALAHMEAYDASNPVTTMFGEQIGEIARQLGALLPEWRIG